MSDHPPVTVLVATRDRVELLCRALTSVWAQDYAGSIHLVVVFDGPVPDAALPQPRHERDSLRVTGNARTAGVSGARNTGLMMATTDLVAFIDDDDEWLPGKLEAQVALLAEHPETVLVGGAIRLTTEDGESMLRRGRGVVTFVELLEDRMTALHTSTFVLRRQALSDSGGFDETLPKGYAEDYDVLLRLARDHGELRMVDSPVAKVHRDVRSYYKSKWETIAEGLEMLLTKYPEFSSSPRGRARLGGQLAFSYAALGERRRSRQWVRQAWGDNWREPRTLLTALVLGRVLRADQVQRLLSVRGRGI